MLLVLSLRAAKGPFTPVGALKSLFLTAKTTRFTKKSNIFDLCGRDHYIESMSTIHELGAAVRTRRTDMGLTQGSVAKLSGLSRATVNQVEKGTIQDLSLKRATRLGDALGLKMIVARPRDSSGVEIMGKTKPLERAVQIANVSYKKSISTESLQQILLTAECPDRFQPHVRALLEEAPVSLLAAVVAQIHGDHGLERGVVWSRMRKLAQLLQSYRELWQ